MTLKTYLVLLATDIDHLNAFVANPNEAAERAGLSPEDRAVLFSGDQNLMYTTLASGERTAEKLK